MSNQPTPDIQTIAEKWTSEYWAEESSYLVKEVITNAILEATTHIATESKVVIDRLRSEVEVTKTINSDLSKLITTLQAKMVKKDEALRQIIEISGSSGDYRKIEIATKALSTQPPTQLLVDRQEWLELKRDKEWLEIQVMRQTEIFISCVSHIEAPHHCQITEPGEYIFLINVLQNGSHVSMFEKVTPPVLKEGEEPLYPCKEWREFRKNKKPWPLIPFKDYADYRNKTNSTTPF